MSSVTLRECWYQPRKSHDYRRGWLHQWGTDHLEYENGPGPYPAGIIEDQETHHCHSICVEDISFAEQAPECK